MLGTWQGLNTERHWQSPHAATPAEDLSTGSIATAALAATNQTLTMKAGTFTYDTNRGNIRLLRPPVNLSGTWSVHGDEITMKVANAQPETFKFFLGDGELVIWVSHGTAHFIPEGAMQKSGRF